MHTRVCGPVVVAVVSGASVPHAAADLSFTGLGLGGGVTSWSAGITADGTTVTGKVDGSGAVARYAFRWTSATGIVIVPALSGYPYSSGAAVSGDGSVMVGEVGPSSSGSFAARWGTTGAATRIGTLPGGTGSVASGVSTDGTIIVGASDVGQQGPTHPFKWTSGGGMKDLGLLPNTSSGGASAISDSGSVIVGSCNNLAGFTSRAFRLSGAVMQDLGVLPGTGDSYANAVSADGSIVVGQSSNVQSNRHAFRWTGATNMVALDLLGELPENFARCITRNGSIIGGCAAADIDEHACYWDGAGVHDLQAVLGAAVPADWQLKQVTGISDNGLTFTGIGLHNGVTEAWVATVPGPGAIVVGVAALGILSRRRRTEI